MQDKARCLEDLAYRVIREWHILGGSEALPKPALEGMLQCPRYNIAQRDSGSPEKTGWIAAQVELPRMAELFDEAEWGKYRFSFFAGQLDPDVYCDDELLGAYIFQGANLDTGRLAMNGKPYIYMRIPAPQTGPIAGIMARSCLDGLHSYNELVRDIARSLRASCQLLSTENRRDNLYVHERLERNNSRLGPDERRMLLDAAVRSADAVDFNAMLAKDRRSFLASLEKAGVLLAPLAEYAKRFTVYLIGHSHIDLAWKWRYPETLECMKGTIETQMELMEQDERYVYVESSAVVWRDLARLYPEFWARVRSFAEKGQFEPQGAMWCEPDGMCVGQEGWIRQIEKGQQTALEYCGKASTCGMNIDGFGFNAGLPKIYNQFGIPNFVTQKLRYNEFTVFPHIHFWWQADDGSRILVLHAYPSHSHSIDPDDIASIVRIHHLTDGFYQIPVMWGYGNHGGGPQREMMERVEELKRLTVYPNVEYSGFTGYFDLLRKREDLSLLPVIEGELFLETHHKTYTVQAKVKERNRDCERRLLNAESLQAAAGTGPSLETAWEKVLFNQFHDILSGTSLPSVYQDVHDDYDIAYSHIRQSDEWCRSQLLGEGDAAYVFNPLAWERDAVIELPAYGYDGASGILEDSRGNQVAYQRTAGNETVVFTAARLPGLGFEQYRIIAGTIASPLTCTADSMSNGRLAVKFNAQKGSISSLVLDGKEYAAGELGQLKILEDTLFRDYETWNMGLTGREWETKCVSFAKVEEGPVRIVFRAKYTFGLWEEKKPYFKMILWHTPAVDYPTSFFTQDFILYANDDMVRCVLYTDWWEDKKVLKVSAQAALTDPKAQYNVPFGMLERPTRRETPYEQARYEVPAYQFADLHDDEKGLAILNRTKHGYDAHGNTIRLTLLASPWGCDRNLVSDPLADRGRHTIEYAYFPHPGDWRQSGMHKAAAEYERGAMVLCGNASCKVKLGSGLLEIDPDKFVVTSVRADGDDLLVRGFEPKGRQAELMGQQVAPHQIAEFRMKGS